MSVYSWASTSLGNSLEEAEKAFVGPVANSPPYLYIYIYFLQVWIVQK